LTREVLTNPDPNRPVKKFPISFEKPRPQQVNQLYQPLSLN